MIISDLNMFFTKRQTVVETMTTSSPTSSSSSSSSSSSTSSSSSSSSSPSSSSSSSPSSLPKIITKMILIFIIASSSSSITTTHGQQHQHQQPQQQQQQQYNKYSNNYNYYGGIFEKLQECTYNSPLGMASGQIQDSQLTSSSSYPFNWDKGCHINFARIYQANGLAWCAKYKSASEWLQVDLGVPAKVTGLLVQGRGDGEEWVTYFMVSYSFDAYYWTYVTDQYGNQKKFEGNTDSYTVKHIYLDDAIVARYIKFHTAEWHKHPSLKVEVIGCQVCKNVISLQPNAKVTSSSTKLESNGSCRNDDAYIMSSGAWCAKINDDTQWLQFDIGPPTLITGFVTKGRSEGKKRSWVTSYKVSYSNDSNGWHYYADGGELVKTFPGNYNANDTSYNYLSRPFTARFIRFHPTTWMKQVTMRAAVLGCPFDGICSQGFMQVNNHAACVENLAYHKESFVNNVRKHSKRHAQSQWTHGQAARAVDGEISRSCMILDNSRVEKPILMVDLGKRKTISGIVIVTWSHGDFNSQPEQSETRQSLSADQIKKYLQNLDKISVYVQKKPQKHQTMATENFCGQLTRYNNALLRPRLHFQCGHSLTGRYVFVEAEGIAERDRKLFGAVLCEVMVYE